MTTLRVDADESRDDTLEDTARAEAADRTPALTVQPKLEVGAADDPLEREADRAADAFASWNRVPSPLAPDVDRGAGGGDDAAADGDVDVAGGRVRRAAAGPASVPSGIDHLALQGGERVRRMIRRVTTDGKTEEEDPAKAAVDSARTGKNVVASTGMAALGMAENPEKTGDGASAVGEFASGVGGQVVGGAFSLVQAVAALVDSFRVLFVAHMNHSDKEQIVAAEKVVAANGTILQQSMAAAKTAEWGKAAEIVPGVDLAAALLSLLVDATRMVQLWQASSAELETIEQAQGKDAKVLQAAQTLHSRTQRQLVITGVNIAADLTMVAGAAVQIAAGPFGTTIKLVGALVKAGTFVANLIMKSNDKSAAEQANKAYDAALAGGDAEAIEKAELARLAADDKAAVIEILSLAVTADESGKMEPALVQMVAAYGIDEGWLDRYRKAGKPQGMLQEAEDSILRFVGNDPTSAIGKLKAGLTGMYRSAFGKGDPAKKEKTPAEIKRNTALIAVPVVKAHAKAAGSGLTQASLNKALEATVIKLRLEYVPPSADPDLDLERIRAIDDGLYHAVSETHPDGIDLATLDVVDGVITVVTAERAMAAVAAIILGPKPAKKPDTDDGMTAAYQVAAMIAGPSAKPTPEALAAAREAAGIIAGPRGPLSLAEVDAAHEAAAIILGPKKKKK